ncbi:acyl carrier protein [Chryseobacterium sp. WG14]|jgi:Acyl carrier protein|uniref:Acyl carrier protein n=1 Tax=Chryseobacterium rhizosphaerae TaxID=395937 RepID=A0AAE4C229_9FLAO|nr:MULTISPECIES: acyl carrier protein [Chryseobacterium]MBL3547693.1 acyl carrier protein [Chryseobacterium sp. KMC2]MCQ9633420.1 acyl carrier protein [Chryseobacterium sp. WG23]MCQ9639678.1 acyl carrier protein [Chryseobacterium sp. WG14]MDC8100279.1 acyl carrier protein [Chryseobacterium rhizosphaerae]MDR6525154.1 acyl carrier protein [Chryseobacterium rhizosphaerae]
MNTTEEFYEIIASAIAIKKELVDENLTYQEIPEWDSMSHLLIVEALEQFYQIKFDFNDILEMGNVGKIREKMKKYDVFVEN